MPKQSIENMNHASATDHRILRDPSEDILARNDLSQAPSDELVYDSRPLGFEDAKPDLRSLALAYPQVAGHYPELRQKGFAVLEQAAKEFPNDAEVQATYGLVLLAVRPGEPALAGDALQKAIALGSKSAEVRTKLGTLRLKQGNVTAAINLFKESIQMDPLYTSTYLELARAYLLSQDSENARKILEGLLKVDPGNDVARQALLQLAASHGDNP